MVLSPVLFYLFWECYQNGFLRLSPYLFFSAYGCNIPWQIFHSAKKLSFFRASFSELSSHSGDSTADLMLVILLGHLKSSTQSLSLICFPVILLTFNALNLHKQFLSKSLGILTRSILSLLVIFVVAVHSV